MPQSISDQRSSIRRKCFIDARIYVDGKPAIPCQMRDLTISGARTALDKGSTLPSRVLIFIPAIAEVRAARVCWSSHQELKIKFIAGEADMSLLLKSGDDGIELMRMQAAELARNHNSETRRPSQFKPAV